MTPSDGVLNPAPKKEHHLTKMKRESKELHELLDTTGASSIEELKAMIAATETPTSVDLPVPTTITNPDVSRETVVDPLAWITKDVKAVYMVSDMTTFVLRPENPRSNPPEPAVLQKSAVVSPWYSNPYDYRMEDRTKEANATIMTAKWWHHTVLRTTAHRWDQDERFERPETAVISPDDFKGWNGEIREALGKDTPITDFVPLRELVRYLLQRSRRTYFNWGRHRGSFHPSIPNPYSRTLPGVGRKILPSVADWDAAGRVTK